MYNWTLGEKSLTLLVLVHDCVQKGGLKFGTDLQQTDLLPVVPLREEPLAVPLPLQGQCGVLKGEK